MNAYKIDVPVLIIFFVRDEVLQKVFDSVRQARPSTLLLWQDGPRKDSPSDYEGIERCRKIVENIDWDCRVYTNYHTENMGCDPSTFLAQKWAFSLVDKCIILEDDMVADESFYAFCKQLLDRYEYDERINHICGVNCFGVEEDCPDDYFFSYFGTGAWASWRRVAQQWDDTYSFLNDEYYLRQLRMKYGEAFVSAYDTALDRRAQKKAYWETILGFNCMLNNRLVIIPKKNLVSNIGMTPNATHGTSLRLMPKSVRKLFYMKTYSLTGSIAHPMYIVPNEDFMKRWYRLHALGYPLLRLCRKIEYFIRCIIYGEYGRIFYAITRRFKNTCG